MRRTDKKADPRAELLKRLAPLRHLSDRDLGVLARALDDIELPAGTILMREGRIAEDWYVILDGEAEVRTGHKSVLSGLLDRPGVTRALLARMTDRLRHAEGAPPDFLGPSSS